MIQKRNKQFWRILGVIIWICGLCLPWSPVFDFCGLDPEPSSATLSGWEEIFFGFGYDMEYIYIKVLNYGLYGLDIDVLFALVGLLEGISLILLAVYIIYAFFFIKKEFIKSRHLSIFLIGTVIVNIFFSQLKRDEMLSGFWMFIVGLLVCMFAEWIDR